MQNCLSQFINVLSCFSRAQCFACQAPLPMGSSRQEYWSGLPCPLPEDLPNAGIKLEPPASPGLAGGFFPTVLSGKPYFIRMSIPSSQFIPLSPSSLASMLLFSTPVWSSCLLSLRVIFFICKTGIIMVARLYGC